MNVKVEMANDVDSVHSVDRETSHTMPRCMILESGLVSHPAEQINIQMMAAFDQVSSHGEG